jgi:DNA-binding beta-propeller fold protein YncE
MNHRVRLTMCLLTLTACGGEPAPAPMPPPPPPPPPTTAAVPDAPATASAAPADAGPPAPAGPAQLTFKPVALPGATAPAALDYIAYEPGHNRVWVPAGGAGSVSVYDVAAGTIAPVGTFKTVERERNGKKRTMGPSAVSIGDGFAYVGNRATSEVCPVDLSTLKAGTCLKLPSPTDGVAYVASAKEVWVTTPKDQTVTVLDASKPTALKIKTKVKFEGGPEGYAVDGTRGLFFTNLEDKNKTVAVDVKTHAIKSTWDLDCGSDGPRGIAAEAAHGMVLVACTDHVVVLDSSGAKLGSVDTGAGVDNIDWLEPQRLLYVAAGKAAKLTIARIDDKGQATIVATGGSTDGARNGVVDAAGNAYVADPVNARLLVFPYSP